MAGSPPSRSPGRPTTSSRSAPLSDLCADTSHLLPQRPDDERLMDRRVAFLDDSGEASRQRRQLGHDVPVLLVVVSLGLGLSHVVSKVDLPLVLQLENEGDASDLDYDVAFVLLARLGQPLCV